MVRSSETKKKNKDPSEYFTGKKAKWLSLFRRLIVRISKIPGVEIVPGSRAFTIRLFGKPKSVFGRIRITLKGLELCLILPKVPVKSTRLTPPSRPLWKSTHCARIAQVDEIDDELLIWVKSALQQARTARRQST